MKQVRYLFMIGCCLLLALGLATTALGATISGAVTNESGQTGRIFLRVLEGGEVPGQWGISTPVAGDYEIRGVPNGSYRVFGYVDKNNDGIPNVSEGYGYSEPFSVSGGSLVGSPNLTLIPQNPADVLPASVYTLRAAPFDSGVLLIWAAPDLHDIFIQADSFRVEWSADDFATAPLGALTVPAGNGRDNEMLFVPGLTNGTLYWFRVISIVGSNDSAPVSKAATPRVRTSGYTVSGTINLDAAPDAVGHPLIIIAEGLGGQQVFFQGVPALPEGGGSFSIPGVVPGYYHLYAFVDMNGDNQPSAGDYWTTITPQVTVTDANIDGPILAIAKPNAIAVIETKHIFAAAGESYGIASYVESGAKRPVNVYLDGPNFPEGVDLAWDLDEAYCSRASAVRPLLDDEYSFVVEYSDGTGDTLTASPSAVYDSPVPDNVSPNGTISAMPASIGWTGNVSLPEGWVIDVDIWGAGFQWESSTMPAPGATSVPYDGPPLKSGGYIVQVEFCEDWNWNCVTRNEVIMVVASPPCAVPASLTVPAADTDGNGYGVSWGASETIGVTYVLEEATDNAFTTGVQTVYSGPDLTTTLNGRSLYNTYYYRVKAMKDGYADSSYRSAVSGCAVPGWLAAKPSSLAVPVADWNSDGAYNVSWGTSATSGVTYVLEESTSPAFYQAAGLRVAYSGTARNAAITGRDPDKTYYYRVKATRPGYRDSVYQTNASGCAIPGITVVTAPPTMMVPSSDSDGTYTVTWSVSATPDVTYVLEEATSPNFMVGLRLAYSGTALSRNFTGRPQNVTYYYRVKAVKAGAKDSAWRGAYKGCALPGTTTVDMPMVVSVPASDADGRYTVSWSAALEPGVKYFLQEATEPTFTLGLRTAYFGVNPTANITGRTAGKTYYYRVQAVKPGLADSGKRAGANGCAVGP